MSQQAPTCCPHDESVNSSCAVSTSDLFQTMAGHDRCAIAIERFGELAPEPNTAFLQIDFVRHIPNDGLPLRIENQIAGIAKQLHPIAPRLEAVEKVRLRRAVFGRAAFDAYIPFRKDV